MTTELERLEPWLDNGTIVLAVQGKCFRVHRSVLGFYSEVFEDMFAVPHSDDAEEDLVDGCPVVHLWDASGDVQMMLKALYDRSFLSFHDGPMPIAVLTVFLRLGKKYAIRRLFKEAVSKKHGKTLFPRVSDTDEYNFMIMNIAHEVGHFSTVAIAAYYCCIACPALIADGYDFNGIRCTLSPSNQQCCLLGERYAERAQRELTGLFTDTKFKNNCGCSDNLVYGLVYMRGRTGAFRAWMDMWDNCLCTLCRGDLKRKYEETKTRLWKDLPVKMGLGSWDDLDKDAEILENVPRAE